MAHANTNLSEINLPDIGFDTPLLGTWRLRMPTGWQPADTMKDAFRKIGSKAFIRTRFIRLCKSTEFRWILIFGVLHSAECSRSIGRAITLWEILL